MSKVLEYTRKGIWLLGVNNYFFNYLKYLICNRV